MLLRLDTDQVGEHQLNRHRGWTAIYCPGVGVDHHSLFPGNFLQH